MKKGFSLIEILVVIALFSVLAVVATSALGISLKGVRKTDNTTKVRESLDFAVSVIERQLRNANSLTTTCPNTNTSRIDYRDQDNLPAFFSCENIGSGDEYISSSSARLTSNAITITACTFVCTAGTTGSPPSVSLSFTARNSGTTNSESATVDIYTQVFLRTY